MHPEDVGVKEKDFQIITIENVLTNGEHNDLGFLVRNSLLVLVEAQTTFSVNLGLRLLLYVAETYRRLGDERGWDVYSSRALEVPRPELAVIYAGSATNVPDSLRVSVVYQQDKEGAMKPEKTEGVLVAFLRSKEKEVRDIMTSLFDETRIRELHDNTIREEGREQGRAEGKADIIAEMLRDNASMSLIEKYTRVSAEKIAEIARSIGVSPVT